MERGFCIYSYDNNQVEKLSSEKGRRARGLRECRSRAGETWTSISRFERAFLGESRASPVSCGPLERSALPGETDQAFRLLPHVRFA